MMAFHSTWFIINVDDGGPLSLSRIAHYSSNRDDPYIDKNHRDDSDDEDLEVHPDDNLIAVGKVHGDFCNLEVSTIALQ